MTALVVKAIELTDRVEAAIESGDWPLAQALESERRRVLEQLASAPDAGDLQPAFTALEARTHRLVGLVEHQKRRVLREAAVARTAQAGAAAYAELGGTANLASRSA
jgi:hypothetical protein